MSLSLRCQTWYKPISDSVIFLVRSAMGYVNWYTVLPAIAGASKGSVGRLHDSVVQSEVNWQAEDAALILAEPIVGVSLLSAAVS